MGNTANLVIVESGEWTLHQAHWVGDRMLDAVAFGPEHAVRYIRAGDESEVGWTDLAPAGGGVMVDYAGAERNWNAGVRASNSIVCTTSPTCATWCLLYAPRMACE